MDAPLEVGENEKPQAIVEAYRQEAIEVRLRIRKVKMNLLRLVLSLDEKGGELGAWHSDRLLLEAWKLEESERYLSSMFLEE